MPDMPDANNFSFDFEKIRSRFTNMSAARLEGFEREMTRKEALKILNIPNQLGALDKDLVRQHHRQLLLRNHPDRGGSTFIATKINEAKEALLGKGK